jgi:hypothetical protein
MSKIKELIKDDNTVLVFDIDGVLSILEWGEYNHYKITDDEWNQACAAGINLYTEERVSKKMQDFLRHKNMNRIYAITKVYDNNEIEFKKDFVNKYYNFFKENVFGVKKNTEKKNILFKIKENYPELENNQIVMIDDTIEILNDVMENTNFSTVHISSFLDI